jgi:response regulator of citrate/malate metabolism
MRGAYKNIQKGIKTNSNLSQDRIDRLEEIGFKWQAGGHDDTFEKHCRDLIVFKERFGNCAVPQRYANNPQLGKWCDHMRTAYKTIQKGMKPHRNLSQDRIDRLEEIGFKWKGDNKTRK